MADEPNKRMDEMLKGYAEKRRQEAGAPVELHPATRQMLQGEVARTYKQVSRASWFQRLIIFWPRVAFAAACLVVTLTLVLLFVPQQRQRLTEMAQTKRLSESESLARDARSWGDADKEKADSFDNFKDAPAVASAPSTAPMLDQRSLDRLAKQNEADELKAKSEVAADAESRKDGNVRLMQEESVGKEVARSFYANNADPVAAGRYTQQTREAQLGVRLQTAQTSQPILNNFELQQAGNAIKIIDEDGSVYNGSLVVSNEAKRFYRHEKNAPATAAAVAGQAPAGPAEQQLFFRAAGTNLRLNAAVSIEANILQLQTNTVPALKPTDTLQQNQRGAAPQQTISGRARVGTNNQEVLIRAISVQQP